MMGFQYTFSSTGGCRISEASTVGEMEESWSDGMVGGLGLLPEVILELVGGFKYFLFSLLFGKDYHFD